MPWREARLRRWQVAAAFVATTVAFVLGLLALQLSVTRTHDLATQNRDLLRRFDEFRRQRALETTSADVKLCEALNRVTARDRATLKAGPASARAFLEALGVDARTIDSFLREQRKQVARELSRRPLVKCGQLPTVGTKAFDGG